MSRQVSQKRVLLVASDINSGFGLSQAIKEATPYQVIFAINVLQALKILAAVQPHLVLVDEQLQGIDGASFIDHIHSLLPKQGIPVVLLTKNCSMACDQDFLVHHLQHLLEHTLAIPPLKG
ncbi:response regulator [Ktedonobacter sp. SOSP1-85]|uniref:response regulator n=1 Tax=Ktedonobacter sp. SOSP1-85 TaxID=2778367 RepID=UPI001915EAF4|nr:response regulator [Ktedonobacter sp. SOSP1-85]